MTDEESTLAQTRLRIWMEQIREAGSVGHASIDRFLLKVERVLAGETTTLGIMACDCCGSTEGARCFYVTPARLPQVDGLNVSVMGDVSGEVIACRAHGVQERRECPCGAELWIGCIATLTNEEQRYQWFDADGRLVAECPECGVRLAATRKEYYAIRHEIHRAAGYSRKQGTP